MLRVTEMRAVSQPSQYQTDITVVTEVQHDALYTPGPATSSCMNFQFPDHNHIACTSAQAKRLVHLQPFPCEHFLTTKVPARRVPIVPPQGSRILDRRTLTTYASYWRASFSTRTSTFSSHLLKRARFEQPLATVRFSYDRLPAPRDTPDPELSCGSVSAGFKHYHCPSKMSR